MEKTLDACQKQWPDKALYLGAQAHLQSFYGHFGFTPVTDIYDEDGIPQHRHGARSETGAIAIRCL